jgi:hypothetical protein
MKYFYAVIFFLSFSSISIHAQKSLQIKPVNEQTKKSYPIDGSLLLQKQYKEVADYITAHPSMYSNMKMQKTAAWGFTVGSTHTWWAQNFTTSSNYQVASTCRGIGTNCYVFVENSSWTNGKVNQAAVDSVINEFDNKTPANPNKGIYQMDVDAFGNPPDVDNDPRIIILILDIQDGYNGSGGFVAGFFAPINETSQSQSNQCEMYYMDCNPTDLTTSSGLGIALETCAHEFQHMINWNYHQTNPEITFINEGCSMLAEINCGYPPSGQSLYANEPNHYLLDWRGSNSTLVLNDYARAQRFFIYWLDQFGIGIFKDIVQDNTTGIAGLSSVLTKDVRTISFPQLFTNWEIANELNNRSVDTKYGYTLAGLPESASKLIYVPNASASDTVNRLAAEYLTFTGGSNLSITFTPQGTQNTLVVKAIEIGTSSSRVVDVPLNSTFSEPGYGSTYSTIHFAVINTDQASNQIYTYQAAQTLASNSYELKWDNTEPIGYLPLNVSDTICVVFNAVAGGTLDSVRIGLRHTGSIVGGVWTYNPNFSKTPLQTKLAGPFTASVTSSPPYPYPVPWPNWGNVDLSSQNISTNKPFAVAFVIPNPDVPGVMVTETSGTSFANSYTYDVGSSSWLYYVDSTIATYQYLIRAYVTFNPTDTSDSTAIATPKKFYLSQNYPNPFNPSTNINFTIPQSERVKILVYNQLGEVVAKLVDRDYNEGPHTVNFNAANLSSGIYFYKIEAGSFVQTKKMMLLK